jgi:hypothetical protein
MIVWLGTWQLQSHSNVGEALSDGDFLLTGDPEHGIEFFVSEGAEWVAGIFIPVVEISVHVNDAVSAIEEAKRSRSWIYETRKACWLNRALLTRQVAQTQVIKF